MFPFHKEQSFPRSTTPAWNIVALPCEVPEAPLKPIVAKSVEQRELDVIQEALRAW